MKKGILTMLLTIVVLTGMILSMTLTASAAATTTDTWDGTTVDTSWHNTTDTAFTIDTAAKLAGLSSIVNAGTDNFSGDTVTLAANINLADKAWTPIGTSSTYSFKGTFDGAGYTISNLKIESTAQYVGMFGYVSVAGTIKNVVLESPDVTTSYSSANASVGALAGYCSGTGNIEYCAVRNGSVSTPSSTCASTYSGLGGVVGCHNTSGNVIGCYNYMTAVSTKDNTMTRCGGVVGSVNKMAKSCYTYNTNQKGTPVAGGYASGSGTPAQYSAYLKADGTESSSISWSSYSVALSAEEFANGTAAYYLRIGAYSEFNTVSFLWGQDVEGDTKETMPVWNGAEVYRVSYVKDVDGTGTVTQMYLNDLETKTIGGNTYRVIRNVYDWVMFSDMVNTNSGSNYPNRNWNAIVEPAGTTLDFSVLGTLAYHNGSWQDVLTIGASSNASGYYNGIFNGNGCKITGLNYSGSGSYALFGYTGTNAYISNITIENANVTTTGTSTYAVFVKENRGTVENCHVVNSTVSAPSGWAGGFAYNNYGGTIKNCSFSGSVTSGNNAGGIAASATSGAQFIQCRNDGDIIGKTTSASSGNYAGGILAQETNGVTISDCYNTGDITGYYAGGIVASRYSNVTTTVTNCHSYGATLTGTTTYPIANESITNCYYLADSETDSVSGTTAKTSNEFSDGTVSALLNGTRTGSSAVWEQGTTMPTLKTPVYYTVTVSAATNGSVSSAKITAAEGDTVTLTVTPATGYTLDTITVTDASGTPVTVTDNAFTMPAKAVTASATFKEGTYTVTFNAGEGEGTMESQSIGSSTAVALSANTFSRTNYDFAGWKDENGNAYTDGQEITLAEDIVLTAQWTPKEYTVTNTATNATFESSVDKVTYGTAAVWTVSANDGYTVDESYITVTIGGSAYTDFTVAENATNTTMLDITIPGDALTGNVVITVTAKLPPADVTVETAINGTVESDVEKASEGDTVTLTVTPEDGYVLDTLTVTDGTTPVNTTAGENGTYTFTMPATAVTISATFTKVSYVTKPELDAAVAELNKLIAANGTSIEEINKALAAINNTLETLDAENRLTEAETALDELVNTTIPSLNEKISDNTANISTNASDIAALETTVETMLTTLSGLADKDTELAGLIEGLDGELDTLSTSLTSLAGRVTTAEAAIEALEAAVDELNKLIEEGGTIDEINTNIKTIQGRLDALEALDAGTRLTAAESAIAALNGAITKLNDETLKTIEANIGANTSGIEELNTTVDKIQTTLESLAEKDKSLAGEIETLKTSLNTLSGSLTSLEGRVTTAESAIETLNNALEELKAVNEADAKTLGEKITALSNALEAAKTTLETTNAATKAELAAQIASARSSLRSSINKVQRNLDEAVAALEVAIADGDSALGDKIAALNTALDSAIVAYQAADSDLKTELTSKIEEADAALDAAIKQLQKDLDDAKAELNKAIADGDTELDGKISNLNDALANELDSVKNELENKTAELQTLIIVVCVISIVALCGIGAFVIWFFIDRKKRI